MLCGTVAMVLLIAASETRKCKRVKKKIIKHMYFLNCYHLMQQCLLRIEIVEEES